MKHFIYYIATVNLFLLFHVADNFTMHKQSFSAARSRSRSREFMESQLDALLVKGYGWETTLTGRDTKNFDALFGKKTYQEGTYPDEMRHAIVPQQVTKTAFTIILDYERKMRKPKNIDNVRNIFLRLIKEFTEPQEDMGQVIVEVMHSVAVLPFNVEFKNTRLHAALADKKICQKADDYCCYKSDIHRNKLKPLLLSERDNERFRACPSISQEKALYNHHKHYQSFTNTLEKIRNTMNQLVTIRFLTLTDHHPHYLGISNDGNKIVHFNPKSGAYIYDDETHQTIRESNEVIACAMSLNGKVIVLAENHSHGVWIDRIENEGNDIQSFLIPNNYKKKVSENKSSSLELTRCGHKALIIISGYVPLFAHFTGQHMKLYPLPAPYSDYQCATMNSRGDIMGIMFDEQKRTSTINRYVALKNKRRFSQTYDLSDADPIVPINTLCVEGEKFCIVKVEGGKAELICNGHGQELILDQHICKGTVSADGRYIYLGTPEGEVIAYDTRYEEKYILASLGSQIIALSAYKRGVAVGTNANGEITIFDIQKLQNTIDDLVNIPEKIWQDQDSSLAAISEETCQLKPSNTVGTIPVKIKRHLDFALPTTPIRQHAQAIFSIPPPAWATPQLKNQGWKVWFLNILKNSKAYALGGILGMAIILGYHNWLQCTPE